MITIIKINDLLKPYIKNPSFCPTHLIPANAGISMARRVYTWEIPGHARNDGVAMWQAGDGHRMESAGRIKQHHPFRFGIFFSSLSAYLIYLS